MWQALCCCPKTPLLAEQDEIELSMGVLDSTPLQEYAVSLMKKLQSASERPPLPVLTHDARIPSGSRGMSLTMLRAVHAFYQSCDGLHKVMGDVCKEPGCGTSVCSLTLSTGLSLAESIVLACGIDSPRAPLLVARATTFFSYSWTGTELGDMLSAVEDVISKLEAEPGAQRRYVWVDMFAASQNLLAGVFKDEQFARGSPGYLARKEDTDRIFDDALDSVHEVCLYASPLV